MRMSGEPGVGIRNSTSIDLLSIGGICTGLNSYTFAVALDISILRRAIGTSTLLRKEGLRLSHRENPE